MGRGFDNIHKVFLLTPNKNYSDGHDFNIAAKFQKGITFNVSSKENLQCTTNHEAAGEENDATYWTKSCAVILSYHRYVCVYNVLTLLTKAFLQMVK